MVVTSTVLLFASFLLLVLGSWLATALLAGALCLVLSLGVVAAGLLEGWLRRRRRARHNRLRADSSTES